MERPNKLWRQWIHGFRQNADLTQTELQLGFANRYFNLPTKWALIVAGTNCGAWRTKVNIHHKALQSHFQYFLFYSAASLVNQDNYMALGIRNGKVVFASNGVELVNNNVMVDDGINEHVIEVFKTGTKISLKVNNDLNTLVTETFENLEDEKLMNQLQEMDFFLGGLPKNSPYWQNQ